MTDSLNCLAYGFIISLIVSGLKKVPFVKDHPKVVAGILSAAVAVGTAFFGDSGLEWQTIARCTAEQFAASVATHEAVVQPVSKNS